MMRLGRVVGLALLIAAAAPGVARAENDSVPPPLWKLARGFTNLAIGLPGEMITQTVGNATSAEAETSAGSTLASVGSGAVKGIGYGCMRMMSGLVDVVTFPFAFGNNRPLVEPEFPL